MKGLGCRRFSVSDFVVCVILLSSVTGLKNSLELNMRRMQLLLVMLNLRIASGGYQFSETGRKVEGGRNMLVAKWINALKFWSESPRQ